MMDDLFNNVNVWHKGRKISIAQHFDSPSSKLMVNLPCKR